MIIYSTTDTVTADQFVDVLRRSTLAERRPVENRDCIDAMLDNADIVVTAWQNDKLLGIARSVTDFAYCCYLSDLAVDRSVQRSGIGKELVRLTRLQLGPECLLILLSAPAATDYYPRIGFQRHASAWTMTADKSID